MFSAGQTGQTGAPGAAPFATQAGKVQGGPAAGNAYGPIGSASLPGAPGAFSAAPGSGASNQQSKLI